MEYTEAFYQKKISEQSVLTLLKTKCILNNDKSMVIDSSLNKQVIGLYFSADWCESSRKVTAMLAEKYEALLISGKDIEIIFVSIDKSENEGYCFFMESMPWKMLSYNDRLFSNELKNLYSIDEFPTLVLLDEFGTITKDGREVIMTVPFEEYRTYEANKYANEQKLKVEVEALRQAFKLDHFFSNCVIDLDSNIVPDQALRGKIVGLYFGAHFCQACRKTTPLLAEKYKSIIGDQNIFEIIYIPFDCSEEIALEYYLSEMPWKMLSYSEQEKITILPHLYNIKGMPSLVLLDENGLISTDGLSSIMNRSFDEIRRVGSISSFSTKKLSEPALIFHI